MDFSKVKVKGANVVDSGLGVYQLTCYIITCSDVTFHSPKLPTPALHCHSVTGDRAMGVCRVSMRVSS